MTHRADWWTCPTEELTAVAAYAGVVIRVIGDVGKRRNLGPVFCGRLVTRVAGGFVFWCCVGEFSVVDGTLGHCQLEGN